MQNLISAFSMFLMRSLATAHSAPWLLPFRCGHMTIWVSFVSKYIIYLHCLYIELLPHRKLRECYSRVTIILQNLNCCSSFVPCSASRDQSVRVHDIDISHSGFTLIWVLAQAGSIVMDRRNNNKASCEFTVNWREKGRATVVEVK